MNRTRNLFCPQNSFPDSSKKCNPGRTPANFLTFAFSKMDEVETKVYTQFSRGVLKE